jgi:hypothetical protein
MELEGIFDHYRLRTSMGENLYEEESYLRPYRAYARRWKLFGSAFSAVESWAARESKATEIAFVGGMFTHLIQQTSLQTRVALFDPGLNDFRTMRPFDVSIQPVWRERFELHRIYIDYRESQHLDGRAVQRVIDAFQKRLERLQVKVLVFWNDVMFVERCMILAARAAGIPSFVIQHGLYMSDQADARIIGGNWADYVFVWGEFFADMFVQARIVKPERVKLLGYPRIAQQLPLRPLPESPVVCVLGQDWECYGLDLEMGKQRFTQNLIDACALTGIQMVYRPHPGESRAWIQRNFPQVMITPDGETLLDAFQKYDVFVSLTSTALVEAGMHGRIALEVIDSSFVQDDFAEIGACHSRPNTVPALTLFFAQVCFGEIKSFPVRETYVWVPSDLVGQLRMVTNAVRSLDVRS